MITCRRFSLLFCVLFILATGPRCQNNKKNDLPPPVGFVNDFENIFSSAEKHFIDSIITGFEAKTTIQFAVITVDTSTTSLKDFDNYILRLANAWGVGQKIKDNGIVIGISKGYRHMRIENGYRIEKIISDAETENIITSAFVPAFKQGNYFEGTVNGIKAIMEKLK
jgi:uncharacterized protein